MSGTRDASRVLFPHSDIPTFCPVIVPFLGLRRWLEGSGAKWHNFLQNKVLWEAISRA